MRLEFRTFCNAALCSSCLANCAKFVGIANECGSSDYSVEESGSGQGHKLLVSMQFHRGPH